MFTLNRFTRVSFVLALLFAGSGMVVGLPTASLSNTPNGAVTGGANSLIPNVDVTAKTKARVDDGANPSDDVIIYYDATDIASANDGATMTCSVSATPSSTEAIIWKVTFGGRGSVDGFTVDAPGNIDSGSYSFDNSCSIWASLSAPNHETQSGNDMGHVTLNNDQSGILSDVCSLTFGTANTPKTMAGNWGEKITVTFSYGAFAGCDLKAQRAEVGVGGKASAGNVEGSIAGWGEVSGLAPVLLKKSGSTEDAVWVLE